MGWSEKFSSANSRGDYYNKHFSKDEYKKQCEILSNIQVKQYFSVDDHEFKVVGIAGRIFQIVKGWLGLKNKTESLQVHSEILKFLHYGLTYDYMSDVTVIECVKKLKENLKTSKNAQITKAIQKVAGQILKTQQENSKKTPAQRLKKVRGVLLDYHKNFHDKLQPSFWNFGYLKVPSKGLQDFGDTYLQLADMAMQNPPILTRLTKAKQEKHQADCKTNLLSVLNHLQSAMNVNNPDPLFQNKIGDLLIKFWKNENMGNKLPEDALAKAQSLFLQLGKSAVDSLDFARAKLYASSILEQTQGHIGGKDLLISACQKAYAKKNYPIAYQYTLNALDQFPGDPQLKKILDDICSTSYANSDYQNAKTYALARLKHFPGSSEAKVCLGASHLKLGEYKEAQSYLPLVASAYKGNADIIARIGWAYWKLKDPASAINYHEKSIGLYEKAIEETQLPGAKQQFLEKCADLSSYLGHAHHSQKYQWHFAKPDYETAVKHYEKACKFAPNDPSFKRRLIEMYIEAGGAASALKNLNKILTFTLSDSQIIEYYKNAKDLATQERGPFINMLINQYESNGKHQEAVSYYEMMKAMWPGEKFVISAETYVKVGNQFLNQDKNKAIECFKKAYAMEPESVPIKTNLGLWILMKALDGHQSLAVTEELLTEAWALSKGTELNNEVSKQLFNARFALAQNYEKQCLFDSFIVGEELDNHKIKVIKEIAPMAIQWYDKVLQIKPDDAKAHFNKAELLNFFLWEGEKSLEEYRLAVKNDKKNPYYRYKLAEMYTSCLGEHAKAKRHKQKALADAPKNFAYDYFSWEEERFHKNKKYNINPHSEPKV